MIKNIQTLLFFLLLSAFVVNGNEPDISSFPAGGVQLFPQKVPSIDFTLKDLNGNDVTLSDLKGKVVVLNFWATWCPPCRVEMPSIERLWQKFKNDDFVWLAIDIQEERKVVADFIKKNNYTFPILLDKEGIQKYVYQARGIPTTYIIDKEGMLVGGVVGSIEWDTDPIITAFQELING